MSATRYRAAQDLVEPRPDAVALAALREEVLAWAPLTEILERQRADGGFGPVDEAVGARVRPP